jgi:CHAT domain-containing protein
MENRERRVFNKAGHRVPRALRAVCVAALPLLLLSDSFATGCDAIMAAEPALFQTSLNVHGREPVKRLLPVPAGSEVMVFARERGTDVTLQITDEAGHVLGRGDSPIRRTGIQRAQLSVLANQHYYIVIAGKEQEGASGSVEIRVVNLQQTINSSCVNAQKLLASADKAYATGQTITSAELDASGMSSDKAYAQAAAGYRAAAASLLAIAGASPLLAQAQHAAAAVLYQDVKNWDAARSWAADAAGSYEALSDEYDKARSQALEAAALLEISMSAKTDSGSTESPQSVRVMLKDARAMLAAVSDFHARRHELYDEALAQNNIGYAYYFEGRYDEAIRAYQQSLPIYEQLHERMRKAQVLQNIGLVEYELGRISMAIPLYQQSLDLISREQNPQARAFVLGNSALANWAAGNEDTALRQYGDSLTLAQTIQDVAAQTVALNGIASVYNTLGDWTRALAYYRQALSLTSPTVQPRTRTASLRAIGNLLRQQGHADEALKMHREALSLASAPSTRARIVVQIAKDLDDLGRSQEAARELEAVLAQRVAGDDVEHARALEERAKHRAAVKDFPGAEADLRSSLQTFQAYESPTDEFEAWVALARLTRRRGATDFAFAAVDRALALAEAVRLQSANPELRSTLLQPLRPAFDLKISMLADQYTAATTDVRARRSIALQALATAEQARARALADFQNLDISAPGLDAKLLERRRAIYREIAARRFRLETSLDRLGAADSHSQAIRSEIATLRQSLDQIDAQIATASETARAPRAADQQLTTWDPGSVPPDVALIEYWLGSENAFAWVLTHAGITMTRLGGSADINSEALALHSALRRFGAVPQADRLEAGEKLYDRVLKPITAQFSASHTLIFAPDGALHYVPFATLRSNDAGRSAFLVESHDIAVTPSIDMLLRPEKPRAATPEGRQMLLVADPVYERHDPRFAGNEEVPPIDTRPNATSVALLRGVADAGPLPRLPGAAREATAIASLLPADSVERLDGFAATREQFLGAALGKYRFIHVASHARTDPEIPQASALILSTVDKLGRDIDGRVLAADLMSFRLQADVVVLSACDTALGKSVAGEGLVGLRYVVVARGARSVVSSLWPAADQVTADLMVRFYSKLLHQHASVISAWSAASRSMLTGRYADPATWGAFSLTLSHIGDVTSR